jgi:antirestriction protein ArdC
MPDARSFHSDSSIDSEANYVAVLAHELCHASGSEKRLNRPAVSGNIMFGSDDYSEEELVAELGSSFICGEIGIAHDIQNSAAYIDSWRKRLSDDSRLLFRAASQAQKAADYILFRGQ